MGNSIIYNVISKTGHHFPMKAKLKRTFNVDAELCNKCGGETQANSSNYKDRESWSYLSVSEHKLQKGLHSLFVRKGSSGGTRSVVRR